MSVLDWIAMEERQGNCVDGESQEDVTTVQNNHEQQKRLVITYIVNDFFKSYAGRQVLGPFHKNLSSIVGPNGSGKSNVIDAMLFVFGYRSKRIRSKKLSLLIHNSEKYPNVDSCTVSVHFQEIIDQTDEKFDIVPNSEFVVSRTARKDGSSEYYVNKKKKTFKEVGALLRQSGIDLDHNRFLILQGEVEQISMMKPKAETENDEGMLEYLEDIIGSSKYKEPIEDLNKDVESLNEQRREKLNRVKAAEVEKEELEEAKNEAIEFLTLENEANKQKHILYQKYSFVCLENAKKAEDSKASVHQQLDEVTTQLRELSARKEAKGKGQHEITKLFQRLTEAADKDKKTFADFEKKDCELQKELQHKQSDLKQLQESLQKENKKLKDLQSASSGNSMEMEKFEATKLELEEEKSTEEKKLQEIMTGLKHETKDLQAHKEVQEKLLMEKQKKVNEAKSKLDLAKSELEIHESQYGRINMDLCKTREDFQATAKSISDADSTITQMQKDIPDIEQKISRTEKELDQLAQEEDKVSLQIKSCRTTLEDARSNLKATKNRNDVHSALIAAKKTGYLEGIHGRLGDLGDIDEKYDVAISTACSPLDFVVVDTVEAASNCVEYLKKNNIGSTTFIALDKMERWREYAQTKITTPENVPRLFDLVSVKEERIANAFFYAIQNTLVADSLEQATRIAYGKGNKRYRVVTLKGELIEQSGTMSGGGKSVAKGRMGRKATKTVTDDEVAVMEEDVQKCICRLEHIHTGKSALEVDLEALKKDLLNKKHSLTKMIMERNTLITQNKEQADRIENLLTQLKNAKPDENQIKQLREQVDFCEKAYDAVNRDATVVDEAVQQLHKKIMDIGGSKLKNQQAKLKTVQELIDEINNNTAKTNVAMRTTDRKILKAKQRMETLTCDIEENRSTVERIKVGVKKLEEDAVEILEQYQTSQEKMLQAEQQLKQVQLEFEEYEEKETELKSRIMDVKHTLQKFDTIIKDNKAKQQHWNSEMEKLALHQLDICENTARETFRILSNDELVEMDKEAVMYDITVKEEQMAKMKPNMTAIAEYRKKEELYLDRVAQLDKVTEERDSKRKEYDCTRKQRLDEFMTGFTIITAKLKEMYQMITLGGDAELELVDSLDPFAEGIVFSVRPPKKSWKNISNLSGGEKTLSSLALVFALHHYKPTPLYVMDEIDAALDFKNVSIVANYIKERTKDAQFIIISLRNNMFELADRLVGIYKTNNCTKSVVINPAVIVQ